MKEFVYLDNAATTKVRPEVVEAMLPYFTEIYGNASAVYDFGQKCKQAIEDARETIGSVHRNQGFKYIFYGRRK